MEPTRRRDRRRGRDHGARGCLWRRRRSDAGSAGAVRARAGHDAGAHADADGSAERLALARANAEAVADAQREADGEPARRRGRPPGLRRHAVHRRGRGPCRDLPQLGRLHRPPVGRPGRLRPGPLDGAEAALPDEGRPERGDLGRDRRRPGATKTRPLIQVGTAGECRGGVERHFAWHQLYPNQPYSRSFAAVIKPGDRMAASVVFRKREFVLTVVDLTTGVTSDGQGAGPEGHPGERRMDRRGPDGRLPGALPPAHPAVVRPDPVHRRPGDARRPPRRRRRSVEPRADDDGHAEGRPAGEDRQRLERRRQLHGQPPVAPASDGAARGVSIGATSNISGDRGPATIPPCRGASSCTERVGFRPWRPSNDPCPVRRRSARRPSIPPRSTDSAISSRRRSGPPPTASST